MTARLTVVKSTAPLEERKRHSRRRLWLLAVSLIALDLFDALSTLWHFRVWTGVYEGNPITGPLISRPVLFVVVKLALVGAGAVILVIQGKRLGYWTLAVANALYVAVALWHIRIFLVPAGGGW